jgi:hypothetical protein
MAAPPRAGKLIVVAAIDIKLIFDEDDPHGSADARHAARFGVQRR